MEPERTRMQRRVLSGAAQRRLLSSAAAPAAGSVRGKLSVRDVDLKVRRG